MGRGSQLYWFLNEKKMPSEAQIKHTYTHLSITSKIKKLRREHLQLIREAKNGSSKRQ